MPRGESVAREISWRRKTRAAPPGGVGGEEGQAQLETNGKARETGRCWKLKFGSLPVRSPYICRVFLYGFFSLVSSSFHVLFSFSSRVFFLFFLTDRAVGSHRTYREWTLLSFHARLLNSCWRTSCNNTLCRLPVFLSVATAPLRGANAQHP